MSIDYDISRVYNQALFIISPFIIISFLFIFKKVKFSHILLALFMILYLLYSGYIFNQFIGGTEVYLNYNNQGFFYDKLYVHQEELSSAKWMFLEMPPTSYKVDNYGNLRLALVMPNNPLWLQNSILLSQTITKEDYVYSSYTNTLFKNAITVYKNKPLTFTFPTEFLNYNKNKIYNNGGSEVFK